MKRGYPPPWACAVLLALLLLWRMLGAPLTAEQFSHLETPFWQARALLPLRVARILTLWFPVDSAEPETLPQEAMTQEERALMAMSDMTDETIAVYVAQEQNLVVLPLEDYVCGVVAAEMPAAYHLEALKAQAVAARTRAVQQRGQGGCALHAGADVCTDSGHCQAYATLEECREKWGDEYQPYRDRVLAAVRETAGEILTYEGEPITVYYHAMSGGRTEDAAAVFGQAEPYLVSVSSEGEEDARGFYADAFVSYETLAEALDSTPDELRRTFAIAQYTQTGRVSTVLVGERHVPASELRESLGLRSTWFTFSMDEEGVTFHQQGYGHGVGMSQVGANAMAADGAPYVQILTHYYPGTSVETY